MIAAPAVNVPEPLLRKQARSPVATSRSPSPSTSPVAVAGVAVAGVNTTPALKPLRVVWSNRKRAGDREGRADGERRVLDLDAEELGGGVDLAAAARTAVIVRSPGSVNVPAGTEPVRLAAMPALVICSEPLSPVMFTNVPSFTARPVTATLTPCAFLLSVIDVALSVWPAIVSVTVPVEATANVGVVPVVSKSTLKAPSKATFGMSTVIAAVIEPVTPPVVLPGEVANSRKPVAIVTAIRRVVPELMAISAFEMSRRVLFVSLVNTKSPLSETPASASVTPVPETANLRRRGDLELGLEAVERERLVHVGVGRVDLEAERALQRHAGDVLQRDGALHAAGDAAAADQPEAAAVRQRQQVLLAVAEREADVGQRELDRRAGARGELLDRDVGAEALAGDADRHADRVDLQVRRGGVDLQREAASRAAVSPALTARVALSVPETRAGAIVRLPLMASTLTAPPARLIAPSVTVSLSSVPERSTTIEPLSSWPTTVSFALATSTRRYAAGSVVSVVSVTVPVSATFGTLSASVALTEPLMPAALIVKRRRALLGDGQRRAAEARDDVRRGDRRDARRRW